MNQPPNSYYQAGFGYGAPGQGQTWPGPGQKVNQPPRGPSGNSPYGPPKAMTGPYSSGAPGVQNQQIYSGQPGYMNMNSSQPNQAVQNGSLTPPSSMTGLPRNEPARQGPGGQLPHQIGQVCETATFLYEYDGKTCTFTCPSLRQRSLSVAGIDVYFTFNTKCLIANENEQLNPN